MSEQALILPTLRESHLFPVGRSLFSPCFLSFRLSSARRRKNCLFSSRGFPTGFCFICIFTFGCLRRLFSAFFFSFYFLVMSAKRQFALSFRVSSGFSFPFRFGLINICWENSRTTLNLLKESESR